MNIKIYIGEDQIDLFGETEAINFTSKLTDIEKLDNVFTDFSDSFSVPATPKNNRIFRHYYDIWNDNSFNANIRVPASIEIDTLPFRNGKMQLEGVTLQNNQISFYKITFYGGLTQLTDLFGDDTIDKLDYAKDFDSGETSLTPTYSAMSQYNIAYTEENFYATLTGSTLGPTGATGTIITPLIAYTNRDWNWGSADSIDIGSDAGCIIGATELKSAIRIGAILEGIENKYAINFSRHFFGRASFNNIFMWMNRQVENNSVFTAPNIVNPFVGSPDLGNVSADTNNFIRIYWHPWNANIFVQQTVFLYYYITPSDPNNLYDVTVKDENGNVFYSKTGAKGYLQIGITLTGQFGGNPNELKLSMFRLEILSKFDNTFSIGVRVKNFLDHQSGGDDVFTDVTSSLNLYDVDSSIAFNTLIQPMKVIDFIQALMKQFKLIIRPLSPVDFYVNTLDGYYDDGTILDITKYVDKKSVQIDRPLIYSELSFNYEKTDNVAGKHFREANDPQLDKTGYGDLRALYPALDDEKKLEIKIPLDNMLYDRVTVSAPHANAGLQGNLMIGQAIKLDDDNITITPNDCKPIFFFNNGIIALSANTLDVDMPIKVKFDTSSSIRLIKQVYLIGTSNNEIFNQVTDSLNFSSDIDPWHNQPTLANLYINYWSNWIDTIYDLNQRKISYTGWLPPRFVNELSLNDRLLINGDRFKINDYTINLTNGQTKLNLFKDVFIPLVDQREFPTFGDEDQLAGPFKKDGANDFYLASTLANDNGDGSFYINGRFSGYGDTTAYAFLKMQADGTPDPDFVITTGFNTLPFAWFDMLNTSGDTVLVSGAFTQWNGASATRIARIKADGTLDPNSNFGTGFNSYTASPTWDNNGKILMCGVFSTYKGIAASRMIRMDELGNRDNTFSITGTGFDNTVLDCVVAADDFIYITGYFSNYNGVPITGVTKLNSNGTLAGGFSVGTGPNVRTNGILSAETGYNGVYVWGYFNVWNGVPTAYIVKLTNSGTTDTTFGATGAGGGLNGVVQGAWWTSDGRIFLAGAFSSYKGHQTLGAVVLNTDGSLYQTFEENGYTDYQLVRNTIYRVSFPLLYLSRFNTATILETSTSAALFNAGRLYLGFNLITNGEWTVTKVADGYGTDWIEVTTPSGEGTSEIVLLADINASTSRRYMYLKCQCENIIKWVRVIQDGFAT